MKEVGVGTDVAVLMADISGSTALYDSVGNTEALNQIDQCLELLRQIIWAHDGHFIHSKGDDVLSVFNNAQNALDAVVMMLEKTEGDSLRLHAGIDFGPVILSRGDVFGDCVNVSSRLSDVANTGEVLCSQSFYDQLDEAGQSKLRFFHTKQFKGKSQEANIYAYSGDETEQQTQIFFGDAPVVDEDPIAANLNKEYGVDLRIGDHTVFSFREGTIKIGRAEDCDLVVPRPWVSRYHVVLEVRQNHLYLRDTSSNGTFVCIEGQIPILVRREVVLLPTFCELSLTKDPLDQEAETIACKANLH